MPYAIFWKIDARCKKNSFNIIPVIADNLINKFR